LILRKIFRIIATRGDLLLKERGVQGGEGWRGKAGKGREGRGGESLNFP